MSNQNEAPDTQAASTTPLLSPAAKNDEPPSSPSRTASPAQVQRSRPLSTVSNQTPAPVITNEYKFVHQRIPPREGKLRFFLPVLLLTFQVIFIVLFAVFASYSVGPLEKKTNHYAMFTDLHAITLLGFGFLMTFLKRYGYGSIGFNLLLVAFVIQWALIVRGWVECNPERNGQFKIGLRNLVNADLTAIAILISFGALVGKATISQLASMAIVESVVQIFNEYLNQNVLMVSFHLSI